MLNLTKPKYVMPVHGDYKRLRLHAELAEAVGIEGDHIFQGRNGLPLEVDSQGAGFGEDIHAGVIYVDGVNIGEPDDAALRDRREISADGIFIVVTTISGDDGSIVADPEVIFRGVAFLEEADALVEDLQDLVEDQLDEAAKAGRRETHLIEEDLHEVIGPLRLAAPTASPDGAPGRHRGLI